MTHNMVSRQRVSWFGAVLRDKAGVSAVEFALVAPVMAASLLGLVEYGSYLYDRTDMHGAVRSGAQYAMNGGRDVTGARDIVLMSWSARPEDAVVNVTRYCLCAEAEHACNTPCPDTQQSVPEVYLRIEAAATLGGLVFDYGHHAAEIVRIR